MPARDEIEAFLAPVPVRAVFDASVKYGPLANTLHVVFEIASMINGGAASRLESVRIAVTDANVVIFHTKGVFRRKPKVVSTHRLAEMGPLQRDGDRRWCKIGRRSFTIARASVQDYEAVRAEVLV